MIKKGKKKQVVCVDKTIQNELSKLTKSFPAAAAVKFVEDTIETDGVPKKIQTDNATAFKSDELRKWTRKYRIKRSFSTPFRIGTVERCIRTYKDT